MENIEKQNPDVNPSANTSEESAVPSKESTADKFKRFFTAFKPGSGYYITPILLNLNILIFILMAATGVDILTPDNESLLKWGANFRPVTLEGQWWRLITACFLHIGILHLALNMYALAYIGSLLEPHLGKGRFLSAYLLTGLAASVTSLWWHELTISAGASGAIFGMYGVFLAMLTSNLIEKTERQAMLTSIGVFVGYNLIYGLKGGIDNAAHIGGLVSGIVIGYVYLPALKNPGNNLFAKIAVVAPALVILIFSVSMYFGISNDIGVYNSKIMAFSPLEDKALEVYNLPEGTSNEQLINKLKEGIADWHKAIDLLNSFNSLDLPAEFVKKNRLLKEYCELRIKNYELLQKAIAENSDQYKDQLENYGKQINAKIKELSAQ